MSAFDPCVRCGHTAVDHHGASHGTASHEGCLALRSSEGKCPCPLTCTEAQTPAELVEARDDPDGDHDRWHDQQYDREPS